jgi:outer membrane protein OmpA-like peptidoglycan-associated protein/tetratricopeptide (TPR) repeat protein
MKKFFNYIVLLSLSASAQTSYQVAGDKLYVRKLYAEAIPKYEKALKKDSSNAVLLAKLGDCYRLTNNVNGEALCYGKLVNNGSASDIQKLLYGKTLMEKGNYDGAKGVFEGYSADERGKNYLKGIANLEKMSKNADAYVVTNAPYNSADDDFCAFQFGENVIFTSSRTKSTWITKHHGWTDRAYFNTYATNRGPSGDFFPPQEFLDGIDSKFNDGPICIAPDCTVVYFTRNSYGKKHKAADGTYKLRLFKAFIIGNSLFEPRDLNINSNDYNTAHPAISYDGSTLYFASDMPGGFGGMDLYYSIMSPDSTWGTPINLGEKVNTKGNEMFPFINKDNILYFASDGLEGYGGLDIYETKIKDTKPTRVYNMGKPINSEHDDFAYNTTGDPNSYPVSGFISSNRKNGGMDDDVYTMQVLRKVARGKNVTFIAKDKDKGDLLANVKLQINGDTARTNDAGEFPYLIEEDTDYKIGASKEKYFDAKDSVNTKSSELDEFTKTILLERDPQLSFLAFVTDAKTNEFLADVKIRIKDLFTKQVFDSASTSAGGEYRKSLAGRKIGDKLAYEITLEKKGYVTNILNYTAEIKKEGEIKLHEELKMVMGKALVGQDLAKIIEIKPIYFDLGKSKIRPDAAVELDKIVKVMNEYPNMYIELGAHTDCRGVAGANKKLSDARAKASAAYIIKAGKFKKDRILGKGYGEAKLLNACACEGKIQPKCSEEEHAVNRRTEFIVTKMK